MNKQEVGFRRCTAVLIVGTAVLLFGLVATVEEVIHELLVTHNIEW